MRQWGLAVTATAALASAVEAGDTFYLVDNLTNELLGGDTGDPAAAARIGFFPPSFWGDLANGATAGQLFALDTGRSQIRTVDTSDASKIETLTTDRDARTIAYDPLSETMYALPNSGANELFTINLVDGTTSTIGLTGITEDPIQTVGMGFDLLTGNLFVSTTRGNLYEIDPADASTDVVGSLGLGQAFDIAYNPGDGLLYATDADADSLYTVDRDDASVSLVGGPYLNSDLATGLAFAVPAPSVLGLIVIAAVGPRRRRHRAACSR